MHAIAARPAACCWQCYDLPVVSLGFSKEVVRLLVERVATPGSAAYADVEALYEEAFPPEERVDLVLLCAAAEKPTVEFVAYYDEGAFCGFTYSVDTGECLYLLFLAVAKDARSHGYGSQIIEGLKDRFPGRSIVLEIEPVEEHAANYDQRLRRLAFYKKNGFAPTGFTSYEDDMTYTVLATKIPFDAAAFIEGVARATDGLLRPDMRS